MGAPQVKNSGFSNSNFNKTGQTITDDIKMRHNFASPVATKVQESPFPNQISSGSDQKEDQHARFIPGKRKKHKHTKKTPEEILQDERGKNVFREIAKMTKDQSDPEK